MSGKTGKEGFIAIVALGIFALLMLFGILVQQTVVNTYKSVKDTDNYYQAQAVADSMMSYMKQVMNSHEAGFATPGKVVCTYTEGGNIGEGNPDICNNDGILSIVDDVVARVGTVKIAFEVKGRPDDAQGNNEKINSAHCQFGPLDVNDGCYTMPMKDGDAGERCSLYSPSFYDEPGSSQVVDQQITGLDFQLDQLNHSCNWNKLTFGSSLSDRVAVPLYYDGADSFEDLPGIVNPYHASMGQGKATKFVLRMRTPCLPCGVPDPVTDLVPEGTRECRAGADISLCSDAERYELEVSNDDEIVVQWQLDGRCTVGVGAAAREQACGLVGYPSEVKESGIYEEIIIAARNRNDVLFDIMRSGRSTHLSDPEEKRIDQIIPTFTAPIFSIFLNHSLSSPQGSIPYLEYQILTDKPIASSKVKLEATVTVGSSSYTATIFKEESKPLIDFAIQN